MTLYEYKILSEDEQYDTVFAKGKFLDIVVDGNSKFVLYSIDMSFAYDFIHDVMCRICTTIYQSSSLSEL